MENFLFTKEEATKIFDDNTSVKEQKDLVKKADSRFGYIMETMSAIIGRKFEWFDFDNENSSDNGNPIRGYFDPEYYSDSISFVGKVIATKNKDFDIYEYDFPTSWLWTNFETQLQEEVEQFEAKNKTIEQKRLDAENQVKDIAKNAKALQEKIYANIPHEMRNSFSFKSPEQIYKEQKDASNEELQAAKKLLKEQEDHLRSVLSPEEFAIIQLKKPEDLIQRKNAKKMKR